MPELQFGRAAMHLVEEEEEGEEQVHQALGSRDERSEDDTRGGARQRLAGQRGWLKAELAAAAVAVLLIGAARLLYRPRLDPAAPATLPGGDKLFLPEQLQQYAGQPGRPLYLAVLGQVFDVTVGARHYGPQGGYSFFAGRDASRSYVTGQFKTDLHDDVADFTGEQFAELARWRDFYTKHKEYFYVGRVVGRFYGADGQPTALLQRAEAAAAAEARQQQQGAAGGGGAMQQGGQGAAGQHMPCNVKWNKAEGGEVWCPDGRFPRRVVQRDWQGAVQEACACLESAAVDDGRRLYDGCKAEQARCQTSAPDSA